VERRGNAKTHLPLEAQRISGQVECVVYARHVEDLELIGGRELMGCKSPVCLSCSDLLCSMAKSIFPVHREVRTINLYQKRIRVNPVNGDDH
jgi:hypothetical protein